MKFLAPVGFVFLLLSTQMVLAQVDTDTFQVRLLIGSDSIPPTTPVLLSVSPVSITQIDLSWSASTDNFAVAGYVVSRAGLSIGTTTLLSYSDTGLTASTTYSYNIQAFDSVFNYSSSSNSLATTTLAVPVVTPTTTSTTTTTNSSAGTVARVILEQLSIIKGVSTTSFNMTTTFPARLKLQWGRTKAYELGYIVSGALTRDHSMLLTQLEPGTQYYYELIGYTPSGYAASIKSDYFVTRAAPLQYTAPANVKYFSTSQIGADVALAWQLPTDNPDLYVRIVRSHLGFPAYPQDGAVIYQGRGSSYYDRGILSQYSPVYYTAFVYDAVGNVSSGAVSIAFANKSVGVVEDLIQRSSSLEDGQRPIRDIIGVPEVITQATSSIQSDRVVVGMKMPRADDIAIQQASLLYTLQENTIRLDSRLPFLIIVPYASVAGNLKSIVATVLDPTDNKQAYSYLLRINKDQTAYEALVAPLQTVGNSQIKVVIYDYEAFVVAEYQAPVVFKAESKQVVVPGFFANPLQQYASYIFILAVLGLLILLYFMLVKRQAEDNR